MRSPLRNASSLDATLIYSTAAALLALYIHHYHSHIPAYLLCLQLKILIYQINTEISFLRFNLDRICAWIPRRNLSTIHPRCTIGNHPPSCRWDYTWSQNTKPNCSRFLRSTSLPEIQRRQIIPRKLWRITHDLGASPKYRLQSKRTWNDLCRHYKLSRFPM